LKEAFRDKPLFAVTADHRREHEEIMDDLGAKHQLCIFHLFKLIGAGVYAVLKSNRVSYRDKIKLCPYFTEIKNVLQDVRSAGRSRAIGAVAG
jgi:hypothetical protein